MDPDAALIALLGACIEHKASPGNDYTRDEFLEALDNLRDWVRNDGFLPNVKAVDTDRHTVSCGTFQIGE